MGSKKKKKPKPTKTFCLNEKQKVNPHLTKPKPHFLFAIYLWLKLSWVLSHPFSFLSVWSALLKLVTLTRVHAVSQCVCGLSFRSNCLSSNFVYTVESYLK